MSERSPAERALDFVVEHGDALAAARARALVTKGASGAVLELLGEGSHAADLARRQHLIWLCTDCGLLASPLARALCTDLAATQHEDGAWRLRGASTDEALRSTGMIAGCLARSPFARPETLDAAGDYLARYWDPDRVSNGRLADLRAYAFFFANAGHERGDEVLQWCGRELERGFRTQTFDSIATLRVLIDCDAHSLPGARFEPGELLVALLTEQARDGSFGRSGDRALRVESTLDGLHALQRFQR